MEVRQKCIDVARGRGGLRSPVAALISFRWFTMGLGESKTKYSIRIPGTVKVLDLPYVQIEDPGHSELHPSRAFSRGLG